MLRHLQNKDKCVEVKFEARDWEDFERVRVFMERKKTK